MFPISKNELDNILAKLQIPDMTSATIRQINSVASLVEDAAGAPIVHLEIGNPGLPAEQIGIEAECEALRSGVANQYPAVTGVPALKNAAHKFIKAFMDVDVPAATIVPTTGSMQGSFTVMMLLKQRIPGKDTLLMLYPGFPAQRHQAKVLGMEMDSFDIYNYRGAKLEEKLEEKFKSGRITAMLYSNPNNPAWTNLTDEELEIIGRLCTKYDVIAIEDLAYLGMDFRKDFSTPGKAPFISTVAKYTDNYIMLISGSKIFSYAGQRIALVCMSDAVYHRQYETYANFYEMPALGDAYAYGILYVCSSGTTHSAQYALAAMMDAASEGRLNFMEHCREYERRAVEVKKCFLNNGFHIVYDMDGEAPIADGFFFTMGYKGLTGGELQAELMRFGVSAIELSSTGSDQDGVRVTVSMISDKNKFDELNRYLANFHEAHRHLQEARDTVCELETAEA